MFATVNEINDGDQTPIIKKKVSIKDLIRILDRYPNLRYITCSRGAYRHFPKKAINALHRMKISLKIVEVKRGRRSSVDAGRIHALLSQGLSAKEISQKLSMPLRTVYYHIQKSKSPSGSADRFRNF